MSTSSEYHKEWYQKNKEKRKKDMKVYYENNKSQIRQQQKEWRESNPEYNKEYYTENKDYYNQYSNNFYKRLRKDPKKGPLYKLHTTLRSKIWESITKNKFNKNESTLEIIGLESWEKLKEHIESQFTKDMNWDNYGIGKDNTTWHIDHIIPKSSATTLEEIKKLNHYTNLRPMWGSDNIRKRNK